MKIKYLILLLSTILFLPGCASMSTFITGEHNVGYVGLPAIEKNLKKDFKEMGYISLLDLVPTSSASKADTWKIPQEDEDYIRIQQCFFKRANPIIILSVDKMDISLKGAISTEGEIKIATKEPPQGMLSGKVYAEQSIPWSIMPVTLKGMPDIYFESKLEKYKDVLSNTTSISAQAKENLYMKIYTNYINMQSSIQYLIDTYNYENLNCETRLKEYNSQNTK